MQNFLFKGVVYNIFSKWLVVYNIFFESELYTIFFWKGNDIKLSLQVPLYGRKFTFVHFHAVCRHILHVENHALSKKYFYAMLGCKKVRNFFQVCVPGPSLWISRYPVNTSSFLYKYIKPRLKLTFLDETLSYPRCPGCGPKIVLWCKPN